MKEKVWSDPLLLAKGAGLGVGLPNVIQKDGQVARYLLQQ